MLTVGKHGDSGGDSGEQLAWGIFTHSQNGPSIIEYFVDLVQQRKMWQQITHSDSSFKHEMFHIADFLRDQHGFYSVYRNRASLRLSVLIVSLHPYPLMISVVICSVACTYQSYVIGAGKRPTMHKD